MAPLSIVIGVCWVIFWIYWLASAFGAKKTLSYGLQRSLGIRVVLLLLAGIIIKILGVHSFTLGTGGISHNPFILAATFTLFLLGLIIAVWARLHLGRNWGMPTTVRKDPQLVTSGPYRLVRHPIYSGVLLAILGSALSANLIWLVLLVVTGVYFTYCARIEEGTMAGEFPKVYPAYKSRTKMLIPFIF